MSLSSNHQTAPDALPDLLLTLTAMCGEFPVSQIGRLAYSESYKQKVVKQLKGEKLLRVYYRDGLRGLRLTAAAKGRLLTAHPDWFQAYLTGNSETNVLKSELARRLRLHRMAEVLVTMHNADVLTFPWEKTPIFQSVDASDKHRVYLPAYYGSREVKELGDEAIKIRSSRATGILLSDGGVFLTFNTASSEMKWEYQAELRFKSMLQLKLWKGWPSPQLAKAPLCGLVFADSMEQLESLISNDSRHSRNYLILDGNFDHFHYLTSDYHGEALLRLLCDPDRKAVLDGILSEGFSARNPDSGVENDAIDEQGFPVLYGYTCDMPRIRRFDAALNQQNKTGTLFCFDFQEETLRRICGPWVKLLSIDFSAFERSVLNNP